MADDEAVELSLPPVPLRYSVELVGRVVRGWSGLHYELLEPIRVPCRVLVRPNPDVGMPFRTGIGIVHADGRVDLAPISAIAVGDYVYRIGDPLTPSLEDRVAALERLLGLVADELEVASDAEAFGRADAAAQVRVQAIARIRALT